MSICSSELLIYCSCHLISRFLPLQKISHRSPVFPYLSATPAHVLPSLLQRHSLCPKCTCRVPVTVKLASSHAVSAYWFQLSFEGWNPVRKGFSCLPGTNEECFVKHHRRAVIGRYDQHEVFCFPKMHLCLQLLIIWQTKSTTTCIHLQNHT